MLDGAINYPIYRTFVMMWSGIDHEIIFPIRCRNTIVIHWNDLPMEKELKASSTPSLMLQVFPGWKVFFNCILKGCRFYSTEYNRARPPKEDTQHPNVMAGNMYHLNCGKLQRKLMIPSFFQGTFDCNP